MVTFVRRQREEPGEGSKREEQIRRGGVPDLSVRREWKTDRAKFRNRRVVHARADAARKGSRGANHREELLRRQTRFGNARSNDLVGRDRREGRCLACVVTRLCRGQADVPLQGSAGRYRETILPDRTAETRDRRNGRVQVEHVPLAFVRLAELPVRLGPVPGNGQMGRLQRRSDLHAGRREGPRGLREDPRHQDTRRDRLSGTRWRWLAMG